jgi:hypothetical protein
LGRRIKVCFVGKEDILPIIVNCLVLVRRAVMYPFTTVFKGNPLLNICLLVPLTSLCTRLEPVLQCALLDGEFVVFDLGLILLVTDRVFGRRAKHLARLRRDFGTSAKVIR